MFKDLKVIDASTVLAGPSVGMFFAELGAEVIKIENPEFPDVTRSWKLPSENKEDKVSAYFSSINYKKQYQSIDLKSESGVDSFLDHIKSADILLLNFKKGDQEKFGIDDTTLLELNPKLIIGKINGFGENSDRVAFDLILQAETGFMAMNGQPESAPTKMPVALIDVLAGHQLKEGILVSLLERTKTHKGKVVSVSLYESAIASLVNQASNYLMGGKIPKRIGSKHPNIAPYGELFTTNDDKLITFAIGSNTHFKKLCVQLNCEELIEDNRFDVNSSRVKNRSELEVILSKKVKLWNSEELLIELNNQFVPAGLVKDLKQVFESQLAQNMIREEKIDGVLTKRVSSIAFKLNDGN